MNVIELGEDAAVREDVVTALKGLHEFTKAQQAFLNSCSDAAWVTDEDRRAIRWLLDALAEHRRRVRVTLRLWRTLSERERLDGRLVAETSALLDENHYFVPHLAKWREIVTERTAAERKAFWDNMITLAQRNLDSTFPAGQGAFRPRT